MFRALLRYLPFVVLGLVLFATLASAVAFLLRQLDLLPPDSLRIAAGPPGSAYHASASAYRDVLARDGIKLQVLETRGSVDNAGLLVGDEDGDTQADVALVQGGVPLTEAINGIAVVHVEPLWVFSKDPVPNDPNLWDGLRIAAGADGSGTRLVADQLQSITGAAPLARASTVDTDARGAAQALLTGSVDIALFVAPTDAPYLQPLLESDELQLRSLAHGEAIVLSLPGARLVRLPSGTIDYARPLPRDDVSLIALVTRLVARDDLHPALVNRLVHAVLEVHRGGSIIPADRQYPAALDLGVEPNDYAAELLKKGFSPLEEVLPYWIVAQLYRVLLILLPALLLFLPLMRILPALYQWLYRRRVLRHYARVHDIDGRLMSERGSLGESDLRALREELDAIERKLLQANLPNSYRKEAYTLLHHLDLVRRRSDEVLRDLA